MRSFFIAVLFSLVATSANAVVYVTIKNVGKDLVVSYQGSVDLRSTTGKADDRFVNSTLLLDLGDGVGAISTHNAFGFVDGYGLDVSSIVAPNVDLFKRWALSGIHSGDNFVVQISPILNTAHLWLPDGYVSGSFFSGTSVFLNNSLSHMQAARGTFEWSWSNGDYSDSLKVTLVPVPAALPLLAGGLGVLGLMGWRRKRTTV
ncbi:hypothetical protein [Labrenzia sp. DG1229]|uniref:hypothetical protein n=1 Tax=Labrenzia sp. DG1229 TaxID=681847 RepID=UPI00048D822A|nr:hypothetical protein [Labrenzia sp. DG1229]